MAGPTVVPAAGPRPAAFVAARRGPAGRGGWRRRGRGCPGKRCAGGTGGGFQPPLPRESDSSGCSYLGVPSLFEGARPTPATENRSCVLSGVAEPQRGGPTVVVHPRRRIAGLTLPSVAVCPQRRHRVTLGHARPAKQAFGPSRRSGLGREEGRPNRAPLLGGLSWRPAGRAIRSVGS